MPPSPPIYGYEMAVEGTGMLLTGFFLAFCCCGMALFGGMTDRHRHISRMLGVKDRRVDLHTRAKNGKGQTWHDNIFRGGVESGTAAPADEQGRGFSFANLWGAPSDAERGFVRVAL